MKRFPFLFIVLISILLLYSCKRTSTQTTPQNSSSTDSTVQLTTKDSINNASKSNYTQEGTTKNVGQTRTNKGIGPIDRVDLPSQINEEMAAEGKKLYNNHCASCHRINENLTGPALGNILDRRTPEFVMNMILNTQEMIEKEPVVMSLKGEYETEMVQVDVTQEEARAIIEYLRKYQ